MPDIDPFATFFWKAITVSSINGRTWNPSHFGFHGMDEFEPCWNVKSDVLSVWKLDYANERGQIDVKSISLLNTGAFHVI